MRKLAWLAVIPLFTACTSAAVIGEDDSAEQGKDGAASSTPGSGASGSSTTAGPGPSGSSTAAQSGAGSNGPQGTTATASSSSRSGQMGPTNFPQDASLPSPDAASPQPEAAPPSCDSGGPFLLHAVWPVGNLTTVTPSAVAVDGSGNIYVTGIFNGSATFGTTTLVAPTALGTGNMFLVKYDGGGNVVYATSFGAQTGVYVPPALAVDAAGNAYIAGAFPLTLDFGNGTAPLVAISLDAFVAKISPAGLALWADRFGYDGGPYTISSVAIGPDGDPVVAGSATGTIDLGGKLWPTDDKFGGAQPFVAKLAAADGSFVWGNAAGGTMDADEDVFVAVDGSERVFVAARMDAYGGGSWGVDSDAGAGGGTLKSGFDPNGNILWSQFDPGTPVGASIDHEGRFAVLEIGYGAEVVGSIHVGSTAYGFGTLTVLASPTDGTPLSALAFGDSFPFGSTVDGNGNMLVTGQYSSGIGLGSVSLPGGASNQLFVLGIDGASNAVAAATLGATNDAQPLAVAEDPRSGNVFVVGTLTTAFTSSAGPVQPGAFIAVFGPDPCDDGTGPAGSSTGDPGNRGALLPDGGSPYVPFDGGPLAACPAPADAVNGAACPSMMGCVYSDECCVCMPSACNGEPTTWSCDVIANPTVCPASPPTPGTACPSSDPSTQTQCDYCMPDGRLDAVCTAGGWETGYANLICE